MDSIIRDHTERPQDEILDPTTDPSEPIRTSNIATENHTAARTPNTRVRKQARGLSSSPDRTHKKTLDENGVIREAVKDKPNSIRQRFFKIRHVPGKIDDLDVPKTPVLTVSQQAERKKKMLGKMTGDQAKHWHKGWNPDLNAEKLKGRSLWVDQAVENEVNTHWAFGTIGLPTWLLTQKDTINDIFQIRANAARKVIEVAKSHLHRKYSSTQEEKDKAAKILDELKGDLDADLASMSRLLVSMHAERHLAAFTKYQKGMAHQPPAVNHRSHLDEAGRPSLRRSRCS